MCTNEELRDSITSLENSIGALGVGVSRLEQQIFDTGGRFDAFTRESRADRVTLNIRVASLESTQMTEERLAEIFRAELSKRDFVTSAGLLPGLVRQVQRSGKRWWGKVAVYTSVSVALVGFYKEFTQIVFFLADRLPR